MLSCSPNTSASGVCAVSNSQITGAVQKLEKAPYLNGFSGVVTTVPDPPSMDARVGVKVTTTGATVQVLPKSLVPYYLPNGEVCPKCEVAINLFAIPPCSCVGKFKEENETTKFGPSRGVLMVSWSLSSWALLGSF